MGNSVIVVESPAKAKTLKKYLGKGFEVFASYGHVRDLLPKQGAVDTENDFAMKYELIDRNSKHVDAISKALKKADTLYLATDPDREGEAISWHLYEILKDKGLLVDKPVYRVAFYEITKKAVQEAVANPRELSMDLVNAQQARRALDYLVGFNLSPLLWKKIRRGLSAGRVQSPALRMIAEREIEIENFVPREYWSVEADLNKAKQDFIAKLVEFDKEKLEQFTVNNEKQAKDIREWLMHAAEGKLTVSHVEKKKRKRNPAAPFTTSTLQQEAARKLGFSASKTMTIAQKLYEGIDTGEETAGLITYMRTDSVNLGDDAVAEIREYIEQAFGKDHLPSEPRAFKTKSKNAQEAHEAIRPTSALQTPDSIKAHLEADQYKLYNLIWKRTVACQMIHATIDTVAVDFQVKDSARFRSNGSMIAIAGFMRLYQEGKDDSKADDADKMLPNMAVGDEVDLRDIRADQHFTEPPPRYSEASLIKALEEHGIGRPSTYASILSTLQAREYVTLEKKRFYPTDVGKIVARFLTEYFTQYVDYDFTANLEDELDAVSRGEFQWIPLLNKFWSPFHKLIGEIETTVKRSDVTQEKTDEKCPECEKPLVIRLGKNGRFYGCTGFPDCSYTRSLETDGDAEEEQAEVIDGRTCPECDSGLEVKTGRYGKFIGCSSYPKCKFMEPLLKPKDTEVRCPQCHEANIMERKTRRGKVFFSCSRYPKCEYALWNEPVSEVCPECRWPILTIKVTKKNGTQKICPQKNCSYSLKLPEGDQDD